jgi:hypothetical protein
LEPRRRGSKKSNSEKGERGGSLKISSERRREGKDDGVVERKKRLKRFG